MTKRLSPESRKRKAEYERARYAKMTLPQHERKREKERKAYHARRKFKRLTPDHRAHLRVKYARRLIERAGCEPPTKCPGCERRLKLFFDHSHATNRFRGWLCRKCNLALGHVNDDMATLLRLAAYVDPSGIGFGT